MSDLGCACTEPLPPWLLAMQPPAEESTPLAGVGAPPPVGLGATASEMTMGILSGSTGSVLIDGAIGGTIGYLLAPESEKALYTVGTAAAAGIGGVFGLALAVGYIVLSKPKRR